MSMIKLEPIPNKWGVLRSHIEDSASDEEYEQTVSFPVRVVIHRHAYGYSETRLATGEKLEDLEGQITLYRGKKPMKDEQCFPNAIFYHEPFPGDDDLPPIAAGFHVQLFLNHRLFDQIVTISHVSRLPWITLDFDFKNGPITYDGCGDKFWNNEVHPSVDIAGVSISISIADQIDKEDSEEGKLLVDSKSAPASSELVDQQSRKNNKVITELRNSISFLTWIVIGIGVIMIGMRFFR